MKKILCITIVCILGLCLCGCSNNVKNVKILEVKSEMYSQEDISSAIDAVIKEFDRHYNNCTLHELYYAGDDVTLEHANWARRYSADEAIVLKSMFYVNRTDGAHTMNVGGKYNWVWILVRSDGGKWKLVDRGFS